MLWLYINVFTKSTQIYVEKHTYVKKEKKNLTFSISELVEKETEEYHKVDPDPFDDRHPGIKSKRS